MTEDEKAKLVEADGRLTLLDFYVSMGAISVNADLSKAEMRIVHGDKVLATWRAGEFLDDVRLVRNAMALILEEVDDAGERSDTVEEPSEDIPGR